MHRKILGMDFELRKLHPIDLYTQCIVDSFSVRTSKIFLESRWFAAESFPAGTPNVCQEHGRKVLCPDMCLADFLRQGKCDCKSQSVALSMQRLFTPWTKLGFSGVELHMADSRPQTNVASNSTSVFPPLDQGIINSLKHHYRKH